MINFFYLVQFEYFTNDYVSSFDLGVFSTKQKAKKKVEQSINLSGFKDFNIDNFEMWCYSTNVNTDSKLELI